jgi:glycosyltransferase involved in cell wall biosynthesis
MLRLADLVTVASPVLATRVSRFNDSVRVIRNAVNPALYSTPTDPDNTKGETRVLYYGTTPRRGDYEVCRSAVNRAARAFPELRRIWLGSDSPSIRAVVDEALPYVAGVPAFAAALVGAQPHIGLAPVLDEAFNRARSELHWLEYTLAGAATIASRTSEPGPYDAIRDGTDGLLASSRGEWLEALTRLAASSTLREELAGHARERVLAEYTVDQRADEWADAYRWAADHAGRGRMAARSLA